MGRLKAFYFLGLCLLGCATPTEPTLQASFSAIEVNGQQVPGLLYVRDQDWKVTLLEETLSFEANRRYARTLRTRYDTRDSVYVIEISDFGTYRISDSAIALTSERGANFHTLLEFQRPLTIRHYYELFSATVVLRRN
ncbi:MAG: hypothetical protein ACRERX_14155 [Pseudomonas sp.]